MEKHVDLRNDAPVHGAHAEPPESLTVGNGAMGNARKTLRSGTKPAADGSSRAAVLAMLESIPDPVVVLDARQHVVFINQHVVHEFGFATAELVGQPLSQLVPHARCAIT